MHYFLSFDKISQRNISLSDAMREIKVETAFWILYPYFEIVKRLHSPLFHLFMGSFKDEIGKWCILTVECYNVFRIKAKNRDNS